MTNDPGLRLKLAKDSLVSSLFELSKCADHTASSILQFYNAIGDDEEEKIEAFTTLTEALQKLGGATHQINGITGDLVNPAEDEKDSLLGAPSPGKATPRKRAERDPNAPKKPLTVFFAYSAFVRQELRDARQRAGLPPLSSTEITQEISKKWKELSDGEKEKWKQAYSVELGHYQLEKQKYLEAKKNGVAPSSEGPSHAPVPIPFSLQHEDVIPEPPSPQAQVQQVQVQHEKRSHDDHGSEKKKKKKKKDKKKESNL